MIQPSEFAEAFWSRLRDSQHRLLALDYDGTLAPFHEDPMKAIPLPGIPEILRDLAMNTHDTIGIISGRPVEEVALLLGNLPVTYVGSHGYEWLKPNGELSFRQPSPKQKAGLQRASEMARSLGYAAALEVKVASVALHTRPMQATAATRAETGCFERWSALAPTHDLECRRFNGGVEIRSLGWHKGDALLKFMDAVPAGTFAVYIGDDDTDEDAFSVVKPHGIGIKVGPATGATAAAMFLADCSEVRAFLQTWHHLVVAGGPRR